MTLYEEISLAVANSIKLDDADRARINNFLQNWFDGVPKKIPDQAKLASKIAQVKQELFKLSKQLELKLTPSGPKIETSPETQHTLVLLTKGSLWFPPLDQAEACIIAAASQDS